jgi:hypothetical protein
MIARPLHAMVLVLTIGGCAGPMGTIHSNPPPAPPSTAFDGSYQTTIHSVDSFGSAQTTSWCQSPGQPVITVAHGQFNYAVPHPNVSGDPTPVFPASMAPDGSFSGQITMGSITGRVNGTRIEGRIDGSACIYTFSGSRV